MKTVQEMAAECGIDIDSDTLCRYEGWREPMERFASVVRAQALEEAATKCFSMRDEEDDLHWRGAMLAASGAIRDLKAAVPPDQETPKGV